MYLAIISWIFVVCLTIGLAGLAVGLGLTTIDDHYNRKPRLWPQIVMEFCGVLLGVGMIIFGSVKLAISDDSLVSTLDVFTFMAALVIGILWLTFIALGLMRYRHEVRQIDYQSMHPTEEFGYDEENDMIIINKDIYFSTTDPHPDKACYYVGGARKRPPTEIFPFLATLIR